MRSTHRFGSVVRVFGASLSVLLAAQEPQALAPRTPTSGDSCTADRQLVGYAACSEAGDTLFSCDFESGLTGCGGWSIDHGVWQMGAPTPTPAAHSGFWCAGTVLNGNYPNGADTRLSSASIVLPALNPCETLQLRFWHWYLIHFDDVASVEIRTLRPTGWGPWAPVRGASADYQGFSSIWTQPSLDLTSYADSTVRIGFRFVTSRCGTCGPTEDLGWYVDDLVVLRAAASPGPASIESFEDGLRDWSVTQGQWEVGVPATDPIGGHTGAACAGTALAGNYYNALDSRLVSPPYDMPALGPCEKLELRFWHWFRVHFDDWGSVEVSTLRPEGWGPFLPVRGAYPVVQGFYPGWSRPSIDVSSYADSTVRFAFRFVTGRCLGCGPTEDLGWYIDDVEVLRGPVWTALESPGAYETFSGGQGDWSVEGGQWEIGSPVDPPVAHSDSSCAGTVLDGNYYNALASRLISPPIRLGSSVADLRLCFWHWYLIQGDDEARVQISTLQDGLWGPWQNLNSDTFVGDSAGWTPYCTEDLAAYANSTIRISFYFSTGRCLGCGPTEDRGWYVDDIQIRGAVTDVASSVPDPKKLVLHQNVPNPFNPSTQIRFYVGEPGPVVLQILDVAGRRIRTLYSGAASVGEMVQTWDGRDDHGQAVASGIYLYRLRAADEASTRRMVLIR